MDAAAATVDALFSAGDPAAVSSALIPLLRSQLNEFAAAVEADFPDLAAQMGERQPQLSGRGEWDCSTAAELLVERELPAWCFLLNQSGYWRDGGLPATGLLLARLHDVQALGEHDDRLLAAVSEHIPAQELGEWERRPSIWVGATTAAAGKYQAFPQQFALFLPEEEGLPTMRRTLFLEDFYHERLRLLSLPVLHECGATAGLHEPRLLALMSQWFRWHDVSHTLHDQAIYRLSGLSALQIHATRELAADLSAIISAEEGDQERLLPLYVAELNRYAMRDDGSRSADALASAAQLGYLIRAFRCTTVIALLEVVLDEPGRAAKVLAKLYQSLAEMITRADSVQADRILAHSSEWSKIVDGQQRRRLKSHADLFVDQSTDAIRRRRGHRATPTLLFCSRTT